MMCDRSTDWIVADCVVLMLVVAAVAASVNPDEINSQILAHD